MSDAGVISPRRSCRRLETSFSSCATLASAEASICTISCHILAVHHRPRGSQSVEVWRCAYCEQLAITGVPGRDLGSTLRHGIDPAVRRGRSGPDDSQPRTPLVFLHGVGAVQMMVVPSIRCFAGFSTAHTCRARSGERNRSRYWRPCPNALAETAPTRHFAVPDGACSRSCK